MTFKTLIVALGGMLATSPALASQALVPEGAPAAPETALYCLKMEPITGTRIGSVLCWTKQEWADNEIDLDEAWAEDGVEVIG